MTWATLGAIIGDRDSLPDALITEARADVLALFDEMDIVANGMRRARLGAIGTRPDAFKPHHCAMSAAHTADAVAEALGKYLGWEVYRQA